MTDTTHVLSGSASYALAQFVRFQIDGLGEQIASERSADELHELITRGQQLVKIKRAVEARAVVSSDLRAMRALLREARDDVMATVRSDAASRERMRGGDCGYAFCGCDTVDHAAGCAECERTYTKNIDNLLLELAGYDHLLALA